MTKSDTPEEDSGSDSGSVSPPTKRAAKQVANVLNVGGQSVTTRNYPDDDFETVIVIIGRSENVTGVTKARVIDRVYRSPAAVDLHDVNSDQGTVQFKPRCP